MKAITFKHDTSQRIYNDYIGRCRRVISILSATDQEDCLMEVNSYIHEYIQNHQEDNETTALLNILDRLGSPETTLKEVVAAKKIDQAVKTFNLKHLVQALLLNLRNGIVYIILFLMTIFLISFPIAIVMELLYPKKTGLFVGKGHFFLGMIDEKLNVPEVLGNWFIPVIILAGLIFYFIIIFLLRIVKNKKS
jgi:uncharacterized membrane protein